jgi:release factor H-coupled RctB family protein
VSGHHAKGVSADTVVATGYLRGHDHAVRWAKANRALVARRFLEQLGASGEGVLDGCHNSVTRRESNGATTWLHRKGAAPADEGAMVIPGSRGTLSYLVLPQGASASTAWSIAHGAGRKWTRSESRARVRGCFGPEQLTQTGLGSRVICENRDLLYEEAPPAYKPIESVISDLAGAGLMSVIATLRPLITYKTRAVKR